MRPAQKLPVPSVNVRVLQSSTHGVQQPDSAKWLVQFLDFLEEAQVKATKLACGLESYIRPEVLRGINIHKLERAESGVTCFQHLILSYKLWWIHSLCNGVWKFWADTIQNHLRLSRTHSRHHLSVHLGLPSDLLPQKREQASFEQDSGENWAIMSGSLLASLQFWRHHID